MGTLLARLDRVHAGYGTRRVLTGLSLDLVQGQQLALLGPSGAGKTTVLRVLTDQLRPAAGTVEFPAGRPRTGFAGQEPLLFEWLTVAENIRLGQGFRGNAGAPSTRVAELIDLLGLAGQVDSYPDEISGGQAQRASLARALAIQPELLLLDEPLSALDPRTRDELQQWLRHQLVGQRLTSVLVTHDIDEALVIADRIVLLDGHGEVRACWDNPEPARNHGAALAHPLRSRIRRGYDVGLEADDSEFSGVATRTPEQRAVSNV